eukprot:scpid88143/ scgid5922/ 
MSCVLDDASRSPPSSSAAAAVAASCILGGGGSRGAARRLMYSTSADSCGSNDTGVGDLAYPHSGTNTPTFSVSRFSFSSKSFASVGDVGINDESEDEDEDEEDDDNESIASPPAERVAGEQAVEDDGDHRELPCQALLRRQLCGGGLDTPVQTIPGDKLLSPAFTPKPIRQPGSLSLSTMSLSSLHYHSGGYEHADLTLGTQSEPVSRRSSLPRASQLANQRRARVFSPERIDMLRNERFVATSSPSTGNSSTDHSSTESLRSCSHSRGGRSNLSVHCGWPGSGLVQDCLIGLSASAGTTPTSSPPPLETRQRAWSFNSGD